jgi:hypothetical protein
MVSLNMGRRCGEESKMMQGSQLGRDNGRSSFEDSPEVDKFGKCQMTGDVSLGTEQWK